MDCNRYSTKEQLLRVTALLKRFGDKTRRQPVPIEVTANELRAAEKLWVNTIQASNFEDERSYLQGVSKKEPLLVRQLDLFLDEEEIRSSCKQKNETHARDPTTEETKEDASSKEPLKANARSTVVTKYFLRSQNNLIAEVFGDIEYECSHADLSTENVSMLDESINSVWNELREDSSFNSMFESLNVTADDTTDDVDCNDMSDAESNHSGS
ncbi:Hypothetical predicted protein [Paramuricea clavata]|uniref:Uncharacterized protein n=1 Tax=Paramuricea clavata TaxID=317549 RepID=A0A7D9JG86_PARCT|nr:Hypothetical predicted protein [Paramuricea clavata]